MSAPVVGIIDYRAGNITSMANALRHLGARVHIVKDSRDFDDLTHVVLPGVGSFGFCARQLRYSDLLPSLERWAVPEGRPLLGVCVGLQLLTTSSDESPGEPGLGWLATRTARLSTEEGRYRLPHVGWDDIAFDSSFAFPYSGPRDYYFDHAYAVIEQPVGASAATCDYGGGFVAALRLGNIHGAQFHPEKSQRAGLEFLAFFLAGS